MHGRAFASSCLGIAPTIHGRILLPEHSKLERTWVRSAIVLAGNSAVE
jgi:hypothetical protein